MVVYNREGFSTTAERRNCKAKLIKDQSTMYPKGFNENAGSDFGSCSEMRKHLSVSVNTMNSIGTLLPSGNRCIQVRIPGKSNKSITSGPDEIVDCKKKYHKEAFTSVCEEKKIVGLF